MAELGHPDFGPSIDHGILDLIGHDADALIGNPRQALGVKIGQPHVPDLTGIPQVGQVREGVQVALILVVPPVELQQVNGIHVHPPQGDANIVFHDLPGHGPWGWYPLGEGLESRKILFASVSQQAASEFANKVFGGAVVVCQVPGGKP